MAKNSANTKDWGNEVVDKILKIIGKKQSDFSSFSDNYRHNISTILKESEQARDNKKVALYIISEVDPKYFFELEALRNDDDIIIAALKRDSSIFARLSSDKMANLTIAKQYIKSLVREQTHFVQVEQLMQKYFPDAKVFSKLLDFYKKYLKVAEYVFGSEIERQLLSLRESSPSLYKLLFEKKLLSSHGKWASITPEFTKYFLESIAAHPNYDKLKDEEKQDFQIHVFIRYLELPKNNTPKNVLEFLELLRDTIHIEQDSKQAQEQDEDIEDEVVVEKKQSPKDEVAERLDYILPQYNFNVSHSGWLQVELAGGVDISLSAKEVENVHNSVLQKYIEGCSFLSNLWLAFALKHQGIFFGTICGGIDPLDTEWLSDSRLLKILNVVAKRIGIPEKEIIVGYNEDGEHKTEKQVGCFHRLEEAVFQFRKIGSSGYVNDELICDLSKKWDRSIIEIALDKKWFYDSQSGAFSKINIWQN